MEVGRLPDLPPGAGRHIHQGGLQGHGGGTLVYTSGAQPIPAWIPPSNLLKPTRTYSPVSSNTPYFFIFSFSLLGYVILRHVGSILRAVGP